MEFEGGMVIARLRLCKACVTRVDSEARSRQVRNIEAF